MAQRVPWCRQLWGNSRATLRQLCGKGRRVYFVDMGHVVGIGHGGDLVVNGDFVGFAGLWWSERSTQVARPSNSHDTPVPTELVCRISSDLVEGEPPEQFPSTAAATYCDRLETDERARVQNCPYAAGRVVRHTHLQRVAFGLLVDGSGGVRC